MSNPQVILFDSSIVIAMLNINSSEKHISEKVIEHIAKYPHAARGIASACLTEIYYITRKKIPPDALATTLRYLGIELFPVESKLEESIFQEYSKISYCSLYDFADYSLCRVAAQFDFSQVLSMDRDDMPLAVSNVMGHFQKSKIELVTWK